MSDDPVRDAGFGLVAALNRWADTGSTPIDVIDATSRFWNLLSQPEDPETPDPRWRPMRTAPRDGTVVGTLDCNREIEWVGGTMLLTMIESGDLIAWRPAHPEWQEDEKS